MTFDEYEAIEKDLLEAYRVGDILTMEELDDELDRLHKQWKDESGE